MLTERLQSAATTKEMSARWSNVSINLSFTADFHPGSRQFVELAGRVCANELHDVPYPYAYPDRIILEFKDGRTVFLDEASDQLMNEWKGEGGDAYDTEDTCSPELLNRMISRWLIEGAIEFAAFVEQPGELSFSRLLVRSDGFVEIYWHSNRSEEFWIFENLRPTGIARFVALTPIIPRPETEKRGFRDMTCGLHPVPPTPS